MSNKDEKFWLEDPFVLIQNFCKFNPLSNRAFSDNMNAYTRLIIIIVVILFTVTKNVNYIYIGLFLIIVLVIIYYSYKKDSLENTETYLSNISKLNLNEEKLPRRESDYYNIKKSENNPLKNVPITDYDKEQEYSKATMSDSDTSKFVNGKMFQTADQWIFDNNTRQYYTMPNSSVPNDQPAFANWLYGTENICKEGSIYMHRSGTPMQTETCNGFNVATPTNFGNLNDYSSS